MPVPDLTAISAVTSSLKATADLAKAMLGIRDEQLVREKAIELTAVVMSAQSGALAAQTAQFGLVDRIRDLEKQIAQLEDWDREKQRYELKDIGSGVLAYATKRGMENSEPPHTICANCYQSGRKSLLQYQKRNPGQRVFLVCNGCSAELVIAGAQEAGEQRPAPKVRKSEWL